MSATHPAPFTAETMQLKIIPFAVLHIAHASTLIPANARASILLSDEALQRELLRMTDHYTAELFTIAPSLATAVVFPVSRLVVDVERFVDDRLEPMAARGMGCIYTRTSEGELLRQEGNSLERDRLMAEYYHPHHQKLTNAVQNALDQGGSCLIIDCHSFSSVPLPHESDQAPDRPDICIGTDDFHTPGTLASQAVRLFEQAGFRTLLNRPFSGSLVPQPFYRRDPRVSSLMVELNRKLYLDESTGLKLPSFDTFRATIHDVVSYLIDACD